MKVVVVEFSPTGGTHRVAEVLAEALGGAARTMDLCDCKADFSAEKLVEDDLAIVAVPSFGGLVPDLALERLAQIDGGGCTAVAVAVYGGRAYEDTLVQLVDACAACGMHVAAGVAGLAQHSILPQYATDRPNELDDEALRDAAAKIREKLESGSDLTSPPEVPGNRPYKKPGSAKLVPKTSKACTQCGVCADGCPAGAIPADDCRKTDGNLCIGCMRCVRICPEEARSVSSVMTKMAAAAIKKECSVPKSVEVYL